MSERRWRGRVRPKRRRAVRPRRSAGEATRVEILKSAAAAFRKFGYHGASVEQIATALAMKKGNLYYYFRNKEEILYACHQYSLDRLLELLDDVEGSGRPAGQKLHRLIVSSVQIILDELHGTALILDLEALTPAHLRAIVVRRDRFDHGVRRIIAEGIATGAFVPVDPKLAAFAILGAVNWIPRWFHPAGPARSEQIGAHFAQHLIAGLRRP
jgi:TetR/AcrR family transcriptional regulator